MSSTNRGAVRHADDFYSTPAWATRAILPHLRPVQSRSVLEPACGDGAIAKELVAAVVKALSSRDTHNGYPIVREAPL